ncbi:tail fiber assembly protein [Morganella morganii]|uniref:tail fiber assembly protein n=1 Tax=Morganella morganii TaxID=582 RepID=UPI00259EDA45|nr:tail fiber assembly protein [Morganella morganii]WOZ89096.1 tail fiber assembly protein [Morganella morganii]
MNYYKDNTGAVWAYDSSQMAIIDKINTPNFDNEKEQIPAIFFEINEKIKGMRKMTAKEIDAHINPPVTKEQLIAEAEAQKRIFIAEANQKTQLWQTQLMLDIITDEDKASLTEWMLYVQKVQAVDTSTAPDIIWPEKPE